MNFEIISVLIFVSILAIIIYRDRKNIEFKSGLLIRRSTKGKKLLYSFASKYEKILKIIGTIGIIVSILASLYGMYLLFHSTYNIIIKKTKESTLRVVLPSVEGVKLPGFILGVPFWYWIISVFVVMAIHEPMHALMARAEKIEVKSFGLLLFFILPGAFVEPNERQLKRHKTLGKLRVFAAGSFGNIIMAGFIFFLIFGFNKILTLIIEPIGVNYESLIQGSYAEKVGLKGTIIRINDKEIKTIDDLSEAMSQVKPGENIIVKTTESEFNIQTIKDEETGRTLIGIKNPYIEYKYVGIFSIYGQVSKNVLTTFQWIEGLFYWIFILNLGVGIFNLFPLKPLDGGLITEAVCEHFFDKNGKKLSNFISIIVLTLIVFNIFGAEIMKIFI
ncbi:MAG: site-2 protease family protein [Candidatus Aenigmatarchaeota archaeon]